MQFVSETKVKEYVMEITGIWGRNRKVKTDFIKLLELADGYNLHTPIEYLAASKLADINAKAGTNYKVYVDNITIEHYNNNGQPFNVRKWSFSIGMPPREILLSGKTK